MQKTGIKVINKNGEKEEILVEEKNLTEKQLQTAFQIFKNAYGYFGKVLKTKYNCK